MPQFRKVTVIAAGAVALSAGLVVGPTAPALAAPAAAGVANAAGAATQAVAPANLVDPGTYPYSTAALNLRDPWGFAIRQCTSYAAWWLNAHGLNLTAYTRGPAGLAHFSNASGWAASAQQAGWAISSTPQVGSIAQWNANERTVWPTAAGPGSFTSGPVGHVAVVVGLDPNTGLAILSSYNANENSSYSVFEGLAPRYLLIGFANSVAPSLPAGAAGTGTSSQSTGGSGAAGAAPSVRAVSGVVDVFDRYGRRTGIRRVPVFATLGKKRVTAHSLLGGGFRATVPSTGKWKLATLVRGHRCTSVTIPTNVAVRATIICRA